MLSQTGFSTVGVTPSTVYGDTGSQRGCFGCGQWWGSTHFRSRGLLRRKNLRIENVDSGPTVTEWIRVLNTKYFSSVAPSRPLCPSTSTESTLTLRRFGVSTPLTISFLRSLSSSLIPGFLCPCPLLDSRPVGSRPRPHSPSLGPSDVGEDLEGKIIYFFEVVQEQNGIFDHDLRRDVSG